MADEHGHGPHIQGYLHAADIVRDAMDEAGLENTLIYPAVHLLRHAAELSLKEAIAKRPPAGTSSKLWKTHDLRWLAEQFEQAYSNDLDASWTAYGDLLKEWEAADKEGTFFRYCRTRDGNVVNLGQDGRLTVERVWKRTYEAVQTVVGIADL